MISDCVEAERLAALRDQQIMDTPPELPFDAIVRAAADQAGAPTAMISLVDDRRQWFKAAVGIDGAETALDNSICARAIRSDGLFVVPDAAADPRFRDMPAVRDGGVRFYAGAPLTMDGHTLGMLCVIDTETRAGLTADEAHTLGLLARRTVAAFALRRAMLAEKAGPGTSQALIDEAAALLDRAAALLERAGATAPLAHLESAIALADACRPD